MPASRPRTRPLTHPDDAYDWRVRNPGRLLNNALRRFEERVMALVNAAWAPETRRSHVNLTRHLDLEGTRITELARRAAMTNAAMTELIDQCEALGLVERVPDPADRRARIVRFTATGRGWLAAFGAAVRQAESELLAELGQPATNRLLDALERYGGTGQGGTGQGSH